MKPKDKKAVNQPQDSGKRNEATSKTDAPDGGGMVAARRWAPPGRTAPPRRAGPLPEGEHIACITKIEGMNSKVYSGYAVVTDWKTLHGLTGRLFINFDDNETRGFIIENNHDMVNTILDAGGMSGKMNPNWQDLARALKDTWFSIEVKRTAKGGHFLAKLEAPDEDDDPPDFATVEGPGPEPEVELEADDEEAPGEIPVPQPEPAPIPEPKPKPAPVPKSPPGREPTPFERAMAKIKLNPRLDDDDEELTFND